MDRDPSNTMLRWQFDLTTLRELHRRALAGDADAEEDMLDWVCVRGLAVPLIETVIGLADEVAMYSKTPIPDEFRSRASGTILALNAQRPLNGVLALAVLTRDSNVDDDSAGADELSRLMAAGYLTLLIEAVAALHELTRALVAFLYPLDPQAATWLTDRLPDLPDEGTAAERLSP